MYAGAFAGFAVAYLTGDRCSAWRGDRGRASLAGASWAC